MKINAIDMLSIDKMINYEELLDQYFSPLIKKWEVERDTVKSRIGESDEYKTMYLVYDNCIKRTQQLLEEIKASL